MKFDLLPFRDRIYAELRKYSETSQTERQFKRKFKDWACKSVLPNVARSVSRVVPIREVRYSLIDGVTEATHVFANNGSGNSGSNAEDQTGTFRMIQALPQTVHCPWLFPLSQFPQVVVAFREFCYDYYRRTKFRCDLPSTGYLIKQDQAAILSPTYTEPACAICVQSTSSPAWGDFLLELSEFARAFRGIPVFNQTGGATAIQMAAAYGDRIAQFSNLRRALDPHNRLLNQFFAELMQ